MEKEAKMIGGILLLFGGFYVLIQVTDFTRIFGLALMGMGVYLILSELK